MSRPSATYSRWALEVRRAKLFRPGERVGAAVSGGPDSVLLLNFMAALARATGLRLAVVHFNHHLRGAESDGDERFVRRLADGLAVDFFGGEADTARAAREKHRNLEATARELRYRFFFSLVNPGSLHRLDKIVTAHTANDQAETVLMRLLRGSGTRGLGGIYPVLDGKILRPFLSLTRSEVEAELAKGNIEFRVDSSNSNVRFVRNRIRRDLMPRLKEYNPGIVLILKQFADRTRDDEVYLERAAFERAQPWLVREAEEQKIPVRALAALPPAVQRRVLRQMIASARADKHPGPVGATHAQIEALRHLAVDGQGGRRLSLPGAIAARKDFNWLIIGPETAFSDAHGFAYPVPIPGEVAVPRLGRLFRFTINEFHDTFKAREAYNEVEGLLDLDKLPPSLLLRNWRPGDRFQPLGRREPSKLKELFQQHKVPQDQRALWPVLEVGGKIVWVRGFPLPSTVASSGSSRRFLRVEEEQLQSR